MLLIERCLSKQKKHSWEGFTLIELLLTVVILGTVAGLAIPVYTTMIEQGRANEANVNLNAIYMAEKIFALNNSGNYWGTGLNPAMSTVNSVLNIDITPQFYAISSITVNNAANPKTFQVVATRNATGGGNGTTTHTIDQTGTYA